jgi:hypothetical protein
MDRQTNVLLTGVPDEILRHPKHGIWIGDYKTARVTDTQDALVAMYEIQLNCYGLIATAIGLKPVYGLGLLYYEPVTNVGHHEVESLTKDASFVLEFSPKLKPINWDPKLIPPLLWRAREICELCECPPGRLDCPDCTRLDRILSVSASKPSTLAQDLLRSLEMVRQSAKLA